MFQRSLFQKVIPYLKTDKILMITGPRQCGKTTLLQQLGIYIQEQGAIYHFLTMEDSEILEQCNTHPRFLFDLFPYQATQKTYYCIDEIQYLKNPTNFLKYLYDLHHENIQLIVTGSSSFYLDDNFKDSLVGRKVTFDMYTLSWQEFLHFKSRDDLITKKEIYSITEKRDLLSLFDEYSVYGGYPEVVLAESYQQKKQFLQSYIRESVKKDIQEGGVKLQEKYMHILKLLASQIGHLVNANEIANVLGISASTVQQYLYVMQKSYHITLIKPFYSTIRKEIIKMPKIYFIDTGLRNAIHNNFETLSIRIDKGYLFENVVGRYFLDQTHSENIRYRRTKTEQEVDFILYEKQAFECKIQANLFKISKYKTFTEMYPSIPLECITMEDIAFQSQF